MNRSTPGLLVHHKLPEFTKTHAHWVGDAIQPSHPLSSPSPPAPQSLPPSGSFPMSQLFAWGGQSTGVSASASVLPVNTQDWSLGWTGWISLLLVSYCTLFLSFFQALSYCLLWIVASRNWAYFRLLLALGFCGLGRGGVPVTLRKIVFFLNYWQANSTASDSWLRNTTEEWRPNGGPNSWYQRVWI